MDFSYSLHHPSFAMRGLSSLNTRPFLTVHRSRYDSVPRLFPSQLQADQLLEPRIEQYQNRDVYRSPPRKRKRLFYEHVSDKDGYPDATQEAIPSEILTSEEQPYHHDIELHNIESDSRALSNEVWRMSKTEVVPPPCSLTPDLYSALAVTENLSPEKSRPSCLRSNGLNKLATGYGNLLALCGSDEQCSVAFSPTGLLSSLTVAEVKLGESGDGAPRHVFGNAWTVGEVPDFLLSDSSPMYDLVSTRPTSNDLEAHMLLATTENGVSLATFDESQLQWRDQFPLQRVTSTTFNPIFREEFSLLCEDGLFTGTAEHLHNCIAREGKYEHFIDLQPVSLTTDLRFRQIHYGTHPRTVLFANSHCIRRYDWRSRDATSLGDVVLDLNEHLSLSKQGVKLGPFQPLVRSGGFQMLLATTIALFYIDVRMPHAPLLDWSLSLPSTLDYMSVCEVPQSEISYDVIALSSQKHNYLEVFHAIHESQGEPYGIAMGDGKESWRPRTPRCEALWSDMPLSHVQKLEGMACNTGLALVQQRKKDHISVLQWSPQDGLEAQLLCVGIFADGERDFEERRDKPVQYPDNSISVWKHHKALVAAEEHTTPRLVNNLADGSLPGSVLHKQTRQMFWIDAIDLRERICRDDDDDVGRSHSATRLPRPYLGDIAYIARYRTRLDVESVRQKKSLDAKSGPVKQDCDSDIGTHSHYSSDGDGGQIEDFADVFTGGCTVSELARCTRSGLAHCRTPLGVSGLEESLEQSSFVVSTTTEWHGTCLELHEESQSQVDSNEKLPDWVNLKVHFAQGSDKHSGVHTSQIPENSDYGLLLRRMQSFFFE